MTTEKPDQQDIQKLQALPFGAALERLNEIYQGPSEGSEERPDEVPITDIVEVPEVFQVRCSALNENHMTTLQDTLERRGGFSTKILLWRCGPYSILIDGHHRVEAFRRFGVKSIPVEWFEGDAVAARKKAACENFVAKLDVTMEQKCDYAWKLTLNTRMSKAEIAEEADVTDRTVGNMRTAKKFLGLDRAITMPNWNHARTVWKREASGPADEGFDEERKLKLVERYRSRMVKAHGTPRYYENEIAALGLKAYYGRHAVDVAKLLLDTYGYQVILKDMDGNVVEVDEEGGLDDQPNHDF